MHLIALFYWYFAVVLFKEWVYIDSRWRTLTTNNCSMLRQTRLLLNQYTDTLSTLKPVSSIITFFM